jgi:hypothetical protein
MQIFGDFIQQFPPEKDSLELTFTPTSIPLKKRWRNNRLSAYFIADYFTTFLPLDDGNAQQQKRIEESKSAVSYIANELLENAMKYNDENSHSQIKFGIHFLDKNNLIAVIFATNSIKLDDVEKLQKFIGRLSSEDPEFLYMEQLEKNALSDCEDYCSGLGFLTIINDYGGKIGWKFDSIEPFNIVTTMVQIQV